MNGTRVKALQEITSNGITVPKDAVGVIVTYPGRDNGQQENQPNIDLGVIRVQYNLPADKTGFVCVPIDRMAGFFETVPVNTALTTLS